MWPAPANMPRHLAIDEVQARSIGPPGKLGQGRSEPLRQSYADGRRPSVAAAYSGRRGNWRGYGGSSEGGNGSLKSSAHMVRSSSLA